MPLWLAELFCPEHGLPVLIPAIMNYWSICRMAMRFHLTQLRARSKRDETPWS